MRLEQGAIKEERILCQLTEPRGIDFRDDKLAIAAENTIYHFDEKGQMTILEDKWFSYIHAVKFHPEEPDRVLISSSGLDLIKEYSIAKQRETYEWLAWEHGFARSHDPASGRELWLTRSPEQAAKWKHQGRAIRLITHPENDHLPTAMRAAFINSVDYGRGGQLIATFFHEGKVMEIDRRSGKVKEVMSGLKNPHGGHLFGEQYRATSTGSGEIVLKEKGKDEVRISFRSLPGKPDELQDLEWIQNTISFQNYLIAIDSNRTSLIIIDPAKQYYDCIAYNDNWALQDLVVGIPNRLQLGALESLNKPAD